MKWLWLVRREGTPALLGTEGRNGIRRGNATGAAWAVLLAPILLAGCMMVPGPRGRVILVPALPQIVVFEAEPYYVQEGYHYHYENGGWFYARSRSGPWAPLPRDRYPREVRYRNGGPERGEGGNPGHDRR